MRISDWSSDVCSSDLLHAGPGYGGSCFPKDTLALMKTAQDHDAPLRLIEATIAVNEQRKRAMGRKVIAAMGGEVRGRTVAVLRSEEHTSELQSLMRISYAVFCLKKKKQNTHRNYNTQHICRNNKTSNKT